MTTHKDLLGGPPPTLLPANTEAIAELTAGASPAEVAADHPTFSLAWALLADQAYGEDRVVESYAFARTGYHRGLDALRRAGWKGFGPVPWEHEPNRGFLMCLNALARAATTINETEEAQRCAEFLAESSPTAVAELSG